MLSFTRIIHDPLGIHARPAGLLAKAAKAHADTTVMLTRGDQSVKATQMMKLMGMGVKRGDEVTVTVEGPEEAEVIEILQKLFEEHL